MYTFLAFDFHKLIRPQKSIIKSKIQIPASTLQKIRHNIFEFQVGDKGKDAI